MRKTVIAVIIGLLFTGLFTANVSAEEIIVKKGDTLWDLAKKHNTTVDNLIHINNLNSTVIYPNQTLVTDNQYIVEKGDSLWKIAIQHNTTVEKLKEWNHLNSDIILIGQTIFIHQSSVQQSTMKTEKAVINQTEVKKEEKPSNASKSTNKNETNATSKETKESFSNQPVAPVETKADATNENGDSFTVTATAYTVESAGGSGVTATGYNLKENPNAKVIAVDPSVIPLGSKVYVEGYGEAIASDTGGAIKGNKIDVHVPTHQEAMNWGVRKVKLTIIN